LGIVGLRSLGTVGATTLAIFPPILSTSGPLDDEKKKTVTMPISMREQSSHDFALQFKGGISQSIIQETRTTMGLNDGFSTVP
jgi:hypothetical protein